MQEEEAKSRPPPDQMTDEERERRYARFYGEGPDGPMRKIIEAPWMEQLFGPRFKGYGLGTLRQAMEDASRRKEEEEEERGNSQPPSEPAPEREKTHLEEEQEKSQPPPRLETVQDGKIQGEVEEQVNSQPPPRPELEREKSRAEEVKPQPPQPTEQAKVQTSWSSYGPWVTFPREEDNPATWICDEYDGEWKPRSAACIPPYRRDPDPEAPQYLDDMAGFYLEAARRLPVAQMPKLAGFLSWGGLLLGFHDPVTNIVVNAIYLMEIFYSSSVDLPRGTDPVRHAADRASYVDIARRSRAALVNFMTFYFRHLTEAQAKRYLGAARHDLALAVGLVERHRNGGLPLDELSPDCSRAKSAFKYAAKAAFQFDGPNFPVVLMRLVESKFPRRLLDPVLDDLRRGEQLSVGRVKDILDMLRHPWSPPPPLPAPTTGTFRDADGNITIIANIGQDLFSTTTITTDRVAEFNNGSNNVVTTTTISRHRSRPDDDHDGLAAHLSAGSDTESRLRALLGTTTAVQLQPDTKSLKMCLLDTIHGLYIQALAMLPSDHQPRLLRAVLAGGHCYGVLEDPVSNIVVNSIWYNARFPHPDDDDLDDDALIKATHSMTRAESSSLHGLIAILRADRGVTEQEAVACLCSNRRNLCHLMMTMTVTKSLNHHSLAAAAEAAKHPQPAALVAFLTTLLLSPEKHDRLHSLLIAKRALSCADFKELNTMIVGNDVAAAPMQSAAFNTIPAATMGGFGTPGRSPFNFNRSIFDTMPAPAPVQKAAPPHDRRPQSYVRTKVEEVLLDYGRNNPLGPQYKLGLICGVDSTTWSSCHRDAGVTCYHVNFLASTPADVPDDATTTTSPTECKLFFAEFWSHASDYFERSKKPPVCCPIQDYHAFPGRCFICEWGSVRIVHPPCANYSMGRDWYSTDDLCAAAERHADLGQQDRLPIESSRDGGSFMYCC